MAEELAAMDVARLRVMSDLVDDDPQGRTLLLLLPHSTGRERCESASERLTSGNRRRTSSLPPGRGGPESLMLTARDVPTSDWTRVKMAPPTDVADPLESGARDGGRWSLHQIAQACAQLRAGAGDTTAS